MTKSLDMLKEVSGIGSSALENFKEAGFESLDDMKGMSRSELKDIPGVGSSTANSIIRLLEREGLRRKEPRTENQEKLQDLLRELFQFDNAELDFGIYKIMNQKRDEIEDFIDSQLIDVVDKEFERYESENIQELKDEVDELKEDIKESFGEDAIENDEVIDMYKGTPLGKQYMEKLNELNEVEVTEPMEAQIFNDIYNFFKHYYEDGDFLTKRRYSRKNKYAVPYNGEEVYLHWANKDQYYVKTAERFKDYRFRLPDDYFVRFELKNAEVDQNNTKGDKKYFLLHGSDPVSYNSDEKTVKVQFEYRPLTDLDMDDYDLSDSSRKTTKTDKIRNKVIDKIMEVAEDKKLLREALESKERGQEKTILEKNLYQYTKKHTSDYFIHKNLGEFLSRELDFYIKNEIVHIDDLGTASEKDVEQYMGRVRIVKKISNRIIDFLAQIENFQKRLWEKKKFVVQTDYCITLDKIPEEYYPEILENEEQIEDWKKLYKLDESMEGSIEQIVGEDEIDTNFLKNHQSMMVDTKFFDEEFKNKLLAVFDNLDDETDGLLIKSENWQALELLQNKLKQSIKNIYIDPPYNRDYKGKKERFVYKDNYKHSSWMTMIFDRIKKSKYLMKKDGAIFISIDDIEVCNLKKVVEKVFGLDNFIAQNIWKKKAGGGADAKYFAEDHEYILVFAKDEKNLNNFSVKMSEELKSSYNRKDENYKELGPYKRKNLHQTGIETDRPNLKYEIEAPDGTKISPPTIWRWEKDRFKKAREEGKIDFVKDHDGNWKVYTKMYLKEGENMREVKPRSILKNVGLTRDGNNEIKDFFGDKIYDYPKPTALIKKCIDANDKKGHIILDFFAGSGTTAQSVIDLNRHDGENRNYILVEMGNYYDTIIIPRIKKTIFSSKWEEGKPKSESNLSHMFKYMYIEQYEDTLNNIKFVQENGLKAFQEFDDYMLNYMLEYETEDSPSLLDIDQLKSPFKYKLKIKEKHESKEKIIDLPETFNYLIGLEVSKRYTKENNDRKYLIYRGKVDGEFAIVIWRNTEDIDLNEDKEFITRDILKGYEENVYINQENTIEDSIPIEKIFKNKVEG